MKRATRLRRRLNSLALLGEVLGAMKSLSAHQVRTSRAALLPARAYRAGIDEILSAAGIVHSAASAPAALLVIAADLGLCNGYNARLLDAALDHAAGHQVGSIYCIGRRPVAALQRARFRVDRRYAAPTGVSSIPPLLLALADDVLGDYLTGVFGRLTVISARFEGVGAFRVKATALLPIQPQPTVQRVPPRYSSPSHLIETTIREYLYSVLFELLLDAAASEHGMRLVATQSAGSWLDAECSTLRSQLTSAKRENSTQEVLDLANGVRARRLRPGQLGVESAPSENPRGTHCLFSHYRPDTTV